MAETATTSVPLAPPPRRNPVIDPATGLMQRVWVTWLELLWKRLGQAHAPSNDALDDSLSGTQDDLTQTQESLTQTQAELEQTRADLATTQDNLELTQAQLTATQAELDATQAQLASDLPPGTARTLTRYQADGSGIETTPGLATTAAGKLGVGVPVPVEQLEVAGGLTVGAATASAANGTMQWNGTDLQGRIAGAWVSLTVGASSVVPGTALRIARYATSGTAVEEAPALFTDSAGGQLIIGSNAVGLGVGTPLVIERDTGVQLALTAPGGGGTSGPALRFRAAGGTLAAMTATPLDYRLGYIDWMGRHDTAFPTAPQAAIRAIAQDAYTATTLGSSLRLFTTLAGTAAFAERLRIDGQGNLTTTATEVTTGLAAGLVLKSGTAPTSTVADAVQLWVADRNAIAGRASLHLSTETGQSYVLGDVLGVGTLGVTASLGSGAIYRPLSVNGAMLLVGASSVQERAQVLLEPAWAVNTDATRTGRFTVSVYDATTARQVLRAETNGTAAMIGFLGAAASARITLPVAATDLATVQTLANAIRTALITFGLGA